MDDNRTEPWEQPNALMNGIAWGLVLGGAIAFWGMVLWVVIALWPS